ncbi:MAG TPA: UDP-N-acetylglucosamine 1-carboxyvinyltransferase [Candidatus Borkfalkia excrementigallinarum]|uniref:UDP-N-acetylglucosamine 1-carboxyvinyltransferase n=1 Tax=Candidatus Borkfalkia excrementigallinarum TaxID=2838506 RepID=A0A9D2CTS1_9FIRM|nr:UDP-N-acetylglucosamine 1-carboxyvinyltransferase [Candidatus Borkfalkia excrementigallinarum]
MEKYIIEGGRPLCGEAEIQSAKNAVLPLLAASVLTDERVVIHKCPRIADVLNMVGILGELGCKTEFDGEDLTIDSADAANHEIPSALAKELRSSVFMLGSVVSRFGRARIAYPGGCDIGLRPIDLHLNGLRRLGVSVSEDGGYIGCACGKIRGAEIVLDCPSVGATENIMLAAAKAEGITVIRNAAKEPEIVDLQNFVNRMGGKISGAGTAAVVIEGVKKLHGAAYTPISDRIEAGTFLVACAMCGGEIELRNADADNIAALLHKLREISCKISAKDDKIYIKSGRRLSPKLIETSPYPGFPTDLQAPMTALASICEGSTVIVENLFETRFKHVPELIRMGADITVRGRSAFVRGVKSLHGADVFASDLRGGAALTLAAISAEGLSTVTDLTYIDRGYSDFEYKLRALGARIRRVRI